MELTPPSDASLYPHSWMDTTPEVSKVSAVTTDTSRALGAATHDAATAFRRS